MRTRGLAAITLGVMSVLSTGLVGATELTVLTSMGVVSGVRDVASAFERATGHKVIVSFEAGPSLMQKVTSNAPADVVTHYPEIIDDLVKQGKVWAAVSISPVLRRCSGESGSAETRHQHARGIQARHARRQVDRLCAHRRERHHRGEADGAAPASPSS